MVSKELQDKYYLMNIAMSEEEYFYLIATIEKEGWFEPLNGLTVNKRRELFNRLLKQYRMNNKEKE